MSALPSAHPQGADHEAAVEWAANLARSLSQITKDQLELAWTGENGVRHRAQLKATGRPMLAQLAAYVRQRAEELAAEAAA